MTAQEKAAYLVLKYMSKVVSKQVAKECALIAVNEILNLGCIQLQYIEVPYWIEVKQKIEKL